MGWLEGRPDITSLRAAVCDLNGILRGKRVPVVQMPKVLEGAMRMPYSITCLDIWGEDVKGNPLVFQQGDIDGRCEPTGRGFLPVNWLGSPTALLPLWMLNEDGTPYLGDPRRALAAVCERYAGLGLTPVVATELEFYLVDTTGEVPTPPRSPVTHKFLDGDGALVDRRPRPFRGVLHRRLCRLRRARGAGRQRDLGERRRAVRDQPAARAGPAEGGGRRALLQAVREGDRAEVRAGGELHGEAVPRPGGERVPRAFQPARPRTGGTSSTTGRRTGRRRCGTRSAGCWR